MDEELIKEEDANKSPNATYKWYLPEYEINNIRAYQEASLNNKPVPPVEN